MLQAFLAKRFKERVRSCGNYADTDVFMGEWHTLKYFLYLFFIISFFILQLIHNIFVITSLVFLFYLQEQLLALCQFDDCFTDQRICFVNGALFLNITFVNMISDTKRGKYLIQYLIVIPSRRKLMDIVSCLTSREETVTLMPASVLFVGSISIE